MRFGTFKLSNYTLIAEKLNDNWEYIIRKNDYGRNNIRMTLKEYTGLTRCHKVDKVLEITSDEYKMFFAGI